MHAVRFFDGEAVREGTVHLEGDAVRLRPEPAPGGTPRLAGLVTGRFTDHHVHLQLVDHSRLAGSRLGAVLDLGAELDEIGRVAVNNSGKLRPAGPGNPDSGAARPVLPELSTVTVRYAGPFLTAPGGYPSDRAWAPAGSVREIADSEHARRTVDELAAAGVAAVKVVAHSEAGPVLDDEMFRTIARAARAHALPVIAHAEGPGQAQRVVALGATHLAHAPFSEVLTDEEIAVQARHVTWLSTMAIHTGEQFDTVVDNVRRFVAAGGTLRYGTDMGNGDMPVDLHDAEVAALRAAGVDGTALLQALAPEDPRSPATPLLLLPDDDPTRAEALTPDTLNDPTRPER